MHIRDNLYYTQIKVKQSPFWNVQKTPCHTRNYGTDHS